MPAWLVSLVVHATALMVLGLIVPNDIPRDDSFEILSVPTEHVGRQAIAELPAAEFASMAAFASEPAAVGIRKSEPELEIPEPELIPLVHSKRSSSAADDIADWMEEESTETGSASGPAKQVEFFGVQAEGRAFVFIVDSSRSMIGDKFKAAKRELAEAIRRLHSDQSFYVIFFDHDIERITLEESGEPENDFVATTDANLAKFNQWLARVENDAWTNPQEALQVAMQLKPDAIFLLTDGEFTDQGRTMRYLAKQRRMLDPETKETTQIVIHTVGFYDRDAEPTLRRIAKQYRGKYRFVAPPKPGDHGER